MTKPCTCQLCNPAPVFLSPEQRELDAHVTLSVGDAVALTKLLGTMGVSDFKKFGLSHAEVRVLHDLHTDLHFLLTEDFGSEVINAELS